ncbi:MAG: hypothetical protein JSV67_06035 [Thermoplasmatales archaeon]|nr:MAG: hypothetical protein JSV67_06035 [Thermoplasmatales archaeon]
MEFVKWFRIFKRKQTSVEGVLISLLVSTISGILITLLGVSMIKKGIFDIYIEKLGKQIDLQIIIRKRNNE